jgi:ribosome-binding factor A
MERVDELLRQALSQVLEEAVEELGMVSVIGVQTTRDLALARILVRSVDRDDQALLALLRQHTARFRRELGQRVELRRLPVLQFILDQASQPVERIEELLLQLARERQ